MSDKYAKRPSTLTLDKAEAMFKAADKENETKRMAIRHKLIAYIDGIIKVNLEKRYLNFEVHVGHGSGAPLDTQSGQGDDYIINYYNHHYGDRVGVTWYCYTNNSARCVYYFRFPESWMGREEEPLY